MTRSAFNTRSGRRRVPFFPETRQKSGSVFQIYNQISLPENGTIFHFPIPRESRLGIRSKRAAFCALKKASITIEAAIVLPLFFIAVITIISMMNVYGLTLERAAALRDTAMTAALITGKSEDERIIDLNVPYSFRPFFWSDITVPCRACVRAWNGRDEGSSEAGKNSAGEYVYVTENRSVYHTSAHCTHLDLSIHAVSASSAAGLRNEYGDKYHACEKCGSQAAGGIVYIASYGDCYHSSASCSGLKRTVKLVEKAAIEDGLCMCSRCAAKAA